MYNKGKLREREVIKMVRTKWEIMLDNLANRIQLIADKHIEKLKKLAEKGWQPRPRNGIIKTS